VIVGWFRQWSRQGESARQPTPRERRAAERTAAAEAALQRTDERIHQLADQARAEFKRPRPGLRRAGRSLAQPGD